MEIKKTTAKSNLNVPVTCSNNFTILLSAIGSAIAVVKLYDIVSIDSFIIGNTQIETSTIIPTIPTAFLSKIVHPKTVSTESLKALPNTGITFAVTAFMPLADNPSTELVKVPSKDKIPMKIVIVVPNTHTTLDLKNLDIFPICTLSEILDTIPIIVDTVIIGNIAIFIIFPIKIIINKITG